MKFYSKILLFGEYSVLYNSNALAIPFPKFYGELKFGNTAEPKVDWSNLILRRFYKSNKQKIEELNPHLGVKFEMDLAQRIYFDSNIPEKYGVGSSGALVAALYDRYVVPRQEFKEITQKTLSTLKEDLSKLEAYFHGQSSGLDPLVSYLNMSVSLNNSQIKVLSGFKPNVSIQLLDTGIKANTGNKMDYFMGKISDETFIQIFKNEYIPEVNDSIFKLINGDLNFYSSLEKVSAFQLQHLKELFTESNQTIGQKGLKSKDYFLKLCGSGGGGFVLVFKKENLPQTDFGGLKLVSLYA